MAKRRQMLLSHEGGRPSYLSLEEAFKQVRQVFDLLAFEHPDLKRLQIERRYWDAPVLYMFWVGADEINRNIAVLVLDEQKPETLKIEINAWRDTPRGDQRFREWNYEEIARLAYMPAAETLQITLAGAYTMVSGWTRENLTKHAAGNSPTLR
jgi:hypothetical protein